MTSENQDAATGRPDEFYVGYLSMPRGLGVIVRIVSICLLVIVVVMQVVLAVSQNDPGDGVYEFGIATELSGRVMVRPGPFLLVAAEDGGIEPVLVVGAMKTGALARLNEYDGQLVRLTGSLIFRDGVTILELAANDDAITAEQELSPAIGATPRSVGLVTLRGEVIDPKCYFGTMKPGHGKVHKACATLCIRGGVPPVLWSVAADGSPRYHLIVSGQDRPMNGQVLEYVGEIIDIEGEELSLGQGPLRILRVDHSAIELRP